MRKEVVVTYFKPNRNHLTGRSHQKYEIPSQDNGNPSHGSLEYEAEVVGFALTYEPCRSMLNVVALIK